MDPVEEWMRSEPAKPEKCPGYTCDHNMCRRQLQWYRDLLDYQDKNMRLRRAIDEIVGTAMLLTLGETGLRTALQRVIDRHMDLLGVEQ